MKNTILKYKTESLEMNIDGNLKTYNVNDYFSKDIGINNIIDKLEPFLALYKTSNGDKLERISYELYNTTDYWDILLLLNNRDPLYGMTYDDDAIRQMVRSLIENYQVVVYSHAPLNQLRTDNLLEQFVNEAIEENERLRNIIIVKPQEINNFISVLRENNYL